jgi:hypothetical protein
VPVAILQKETLMLDALLIALDETEREAAHPDLFALTALFDKLRPSTNAYTRQRPIGAATSLRVQDASLVIADGPFAETKEQILRLVVVGCDALGDGAACGPRSRESTKELYR